MAINPNNICIEGYKIIGFLGSGTYAYVYKAVEEASGETVAIKCVEQSKLSSTGKDNIVTEIKVMKMLKNDHIVEMRDFKWDNNHVYIIMEYCDGGDLSKYIANYRRLSEKQCKSVMQHLALGMKFLRSKNICHFDLKPQNLLINTKPWTLKIGGCASIAYFNNIVLDFGFASFLSDETMKVSIRGSPLYMAPEMLLTKSFNIKGDLWSIGVIMYECLVGKAPMSHNSCKELITLLLQQTPINIPSTLSQPCKELLKLLLVYDPEKRISYEAFFQHSFIDLEHYPSKESFLKAVGIVHEAVKCDNQKNYLEALNLYCSALNYFIPYLSICSDQIEREKIRNKITEYTKRAEVLKTTLHKSKIVLSSLNSQRDTIIEGINTETKELVALSRGTPKIHDALDIGFSGELYFCEGRLDIALEKLQSSLSVLIPALTEEPEGIRKTLLSQQIQTWLTLAENADTLIKARAMSVAENV